jgi:hypothetical protein
MRWYGPVGRLLRIRLRDTWVPSLGCQTRPYESLTNSVGVGKKPGLPVRLPGDSCRWCEFSLLFILRQPSHHPGWAMRYLHAAGIAASR